MTHWGDITKLSGYNMPPVDVIIGGSPCQDLSVAGKRSGLAGERSGLFMEQIRVVKELRDADRKRGMSGELVRPRFMLWENVPGVLSSNGGEDFKAVLEETIRIAQPDAPDIPRPKKWTMADAYFGDGWSVAYRIFDAQFWGVPQRRRRICLVADFGGHAAPEILFVREILSGDTASVGGTRGGTSPGTEGDTYPTVARALSARNGIKCLNPKEIQQQRIYLPNGVAPTLSSAEKRYGGIQILIYCGGSIRRLTPLECERLQGFPDGYTDIGDMKCDNGKTNKTPDSARYRALGNSIALPPWKWVLKRLSAQYERDATLGSLFDGIGGFPFLWEQINGKGSCLWASEIEKFPIAVTKCRFGGE